MIMEAHKEAPLPNFIPLINNEMKTVGGKKPMSASTVETTVETTIPNVAPTSNDKAMKLEHLRTEVPPSLTLPIDKLAPEVQDYIRTVADSFGCPQDYVTAYCFVAAGIAAGKKVVLQTNPYENYPCCFLCIVGNPSQNKTSPLKEVFRPLRELDKVNFEKYKEEKNTYEQNKMAGKNDRNPPPVFHQRVAGDSSPESRNALLAQGDMIIVVADELQSFTDSFGRYAKGGNGAGIEIAQLLSIWSNVSFSINRKMEDTKLVADPAMSIVGGIQPGLLGKTFGSDTMMRSGFTQRFLFVYPEKTIFVRRRDRQSMTEEMRGRWDSIIHKLFNMAPLSLQLSSEASQIYDDYADSNDIKADAESEAYIGGTMQKMNISVLRLTIMAHLLSDKWNRPVITAEEMRYAIQFADYFMQIHIERIYPLLKSPTIPHEMSNGELIRELNRRFKIKSQNALAGVLGVSQQYINKTISDGCNCRYRQVLD